MQYKTITLELLQRYHLPPTIASLDRYSAELRQSHLDWKQKLLEQNPEDCQAASRALELALEELETQLRQLAQEPTEAPAE